jgi:hypothetical protein
MESEPGWLRVIRAFLDERDDADAESGVVSYVSDLKDVRAILVCGTQVFSALRGAAEMSVVVPEGLHDPEARGMREAV